MPAKTIHHHMENPLVVCVAAHEEVDVHRFRASNPPNSVDAPLTLLDLRGVPLEVVVNDVAAVRLEVDSLLAD